jgi:hypothetical protein
MPGSAKAVTRTVLEYVDGEPINRATVGAAVDNA